MQKILVVAEYQNGELDNTTFELLSKGRKLADNLGGALQLIIVGHKLHSTIELLQSKGVDNIYVTDSSIAEEYNPELYCRVISDIARRAKPNLLLIGHTYYGMELAPAIATILGAGLVTNCIDVELLNGTMVVTRPMFGRTAHVRLELQGSVPFVVSFQPGTLSAELLAPGKATISPVPVDIALSDIRTRVLGLKKPPAGETDITKADILVAVGRGIRDQANIGLARELASALGGTIACSRPIADLQWLPPEYHVGMSGKTVKPKVYIACGISGASQHVAGMKDSQVIIAINNDPQAPIFQVAHYGVVGDVIKILPALIREAKSGLKISDLAKNC